MLRRQNDSDVLQLRHARSGHLPHLRATFPFRTNPASIADVAGSFVRHEGDGGLVRMILPRRCSKPPGTAGEIDGGDWIFLQPQAPRGEGSWNRQQRYHVHSAGLV